jgi:light-regulated signal transduction histidine kinase (bacteriophytochrome)
MTPVTQRVIHTIPDSTRKKREDMVSPSLNAELQKAREEIARLRQANEELQRFTAVVSHDLREPLRMVSAYTRLLAERYRGRFDAEADEHLTFITGGAEWMTELISDLLEYARAGNERTRLISVDSQFCFEGALRISEPPWRRPEPSSSAICYRPCWPPLNSPRAFKT